MLFFFFCMFRQYELSVTRSQLSTVRNSWANRAPSRAAVRNPNRTLAFHFNLLARKQTAVSFTPSQTSAWLACQRTRLRNRPCLRTLVRTDVHSPNRQGALSKTPAQNRHQSAGGGHMTRSANQLRVTRRSEWCRGTAVQQPGRLCRSRHSKVEIEAERTETWDIWRDTCQNRSCAVLRSRPICFVQYFQVGARGRTRTDTPRGGGF